MPKIKMLTFHNAENYGAALQAYALKETIKSMGSTPEFINYENTKVLSDYRLIRLDSLKSFFSSIWFFCRNLKRKRSFKSFSDTYLDTKTKRYKTYKEIEKDIVCEDILLSGSDQILNPVLTGGVDDVYSLNFNNDNKKIVYGASLGNEELLKEYEASFKEKLANIDLLSVREKSIINLLEEILDKKVEQVIDPTLLLGKEKWDKLILENNVVPLKSSKYILVYTLFESEEVTKIVNFLSKTTGCRVVHFRKYNAYENELQSLYSYGPADFVNAFKNASYIVTNSFHGTVFSVIYEKMFYSILPKERQGRIKDLLNSLNLEDRIVHDESKIDINKNINYDLVKKKLETLKTKSIDFLKKGVSNNNV